MADARSTLALVLGGGGPVGRAWEWGLAAGFLSSGIDWRTAERVVGTSAGAVVGAQLGIGLDPTRGPPAMDPEGRVPPMSPGFLLLAQLMARAARSDAPEQVRQQIGQLALTGSTMTESASLGRAAFAPLFGQAFPDALWATSVSVHTGRLQIWQASSGVPLERATAASAALPGVWPPITLGDDRYMDGGVRSLLNADLARGFARVLVVSCVELRVPEQPNDPTAIRNAALRSEIEALRREGAAVEVLAPDAPFLTLTRQGSRLLDPSLATEAYACGRRQALLEAQRIGTLWHAP